jgi:hypothetical protein
MSLPWWSLPLLCIIHNIQVQWMDKENVVYTHTHTITQPERTKLCHLQGMYRTGEHHVKWCKLESERQILYAFSKWGCRLKEKKMKAEGSQWGSMGRGVDKRGVGGWVKSKCIICKYGMKMSQRNPRFHDINNKKINCSLFLDMLYILAC